MQPDLARRIDQLLAARSELIVRLAQVFERLLRVLENARATFYKACKVVRNDCCRHRNCMALSAIAKVGGIGVREIDDGSVAECAGSLFRAKNYYFHERLLGVWRLG